MKKNFLQDVVPSQRRSIRDIPLPSHRESARPATSDVKPRKKKVVREEPVYEESSVEEEVYTPPQHTPHYEEQEEEEVQYQPPVRRPRKKSSSSLSKKILITVISAAALFIIISASRTKAEIIITPKKSQSNVSIAIPTDSSSLATKTQLTKTATRTLQATGEQQVEKQASGKIKIINTHKETPQELVKNTRFQAPNGLIYRIKDSIVVPGYKMNGTSIVPGTLEVEVFADSAGEDYNTSGQVKFTIPGFEGKEQFDKITAESVGNMTGGYIGIQKVVSDEAKEKAEEELKKELTEQFNQSQNESTEYVIVPNTETLSFGELQDKAEGNSVVLTLTARVDAYSFAKKDLQNFIGQNSITGASTSDMFTLDTSVLTFEINEQGISISGNTEITYVTDTEKIKSDFAGKKRSESMTIIDSYNSIREAKANLKPFWKTKFPADSSKIEVTTLN